MCLYRSETVNKKGAIMKQCQIHGLPVMAEPVGIVEKLYQRRNRIRRVVKRRRNYLLSVLAEITGQKGKTDNYTAVSRSKETPEPGDRVRVKSKEDIQKTLNRWNQLKGCSFMEEMWPYCGTTQKILKRIEKFLDERDYLIKKCKGIVILDGVFCEGTKDFGP